MHSSTTFERKIAVSKQIARNREVAEKAAETLKAKKGSLKTKSIESASFAASVEKTEKPPMKPPRVPGKILLAAFDIDLISGKHAYVFDKTHLRSIYEGLDLEILQPAGQSMVYFFAKAKVNINEINSSRHPFCRSGETLVAMPNDEILNIFEGAKGRVVRYQGTNYYFEKKSSY